MNNGAGLFLFLSAQLAANHDCGKFVGDSHGGVFAVVGILILARLFLLRIFLARV